MVITWLTPCVVMGIGREGVWGVLPTYRFQSKVILPYTVKVLDKWNNVYIVLSYAQISSKLLYFAIKILWERVSLKILLPAEIISGSTYWLSVLIFTFSNEILRYILSRLQTLCKISSTCSTERSLLFFVSFLSFSPTHSFICSAHITSKMQIPSKGKWAHHRQAP